MFILENVTCGGLSNLVMDSQIPNITSTLITLIKIGVPLLLIVFGMLDLGKAVMAQKEDEIKKGQQTLIKRATAAAIVFFVVWIVQIIVGLIAPNDSKNITNCIDCFVNNNCEKVQ